MVFTVGGFLKNKSLNVIFHFKYLMPSTKGKKDNYHETKLIYNSKNKGVFYG